MKKFLHLKFVFAFLLLGSLGFSIISLAGEVMTLQHVESVYSEQLYREATSIALTHSAGIL